MQLTRRRVRRSAVLAVALGVVLGACGDDQQSSTSLPAASSTATITATTPTTTIASAPATDIVEIIAVYDGVEAYPACGNEPIGHLGVVWYPVAFAGGAPTGAQFRSLVDEVFAVEREASPVAGPMGVARVAPPGPGDDIGTLVVWADGVARWVSDSGVLDVWLIDDEVTYNWVC
jgi:hypothetical protein